MSPISSGRPTSTTGIPSSSAARRAPATISAGARSPPMASTATGSMAQSGPDRSTRLRIPWPMMIQTIRRRIWFHHRAARPMVRPRPAVRNNGYSTSMACRSWYQPQLPHTRWGRLTAPQRLQALRPPERMRHAEALRLRALAFEVFFLGTAMGFGDPRLRFARLRPASLPARRLADTSPPSMPGGRRPITQPVGPVGLRVAPARCTGRGRPSRKTVRLGPSTVRRAQRGQRQSQHCDLAHSRSQVYSLIVDRPGLALRGLPLEHLAQYRVQWAPHLLEASAALSGPRSSHSTSRDEGVASGSHRQVQVDNAVCHTGAVHAGLIQNPFSADLYPIDGARLEPDAIDHQPGFHSAQVLVEHVVFDCGGLRQLRGPRQPGVLEPPASRRHGFDGLVQHRLKGRQALVAPVLRLKLRPPGPAPRLPTRCVAPASPRP